MANMTFKANLLPSTTLGYSLGSSDKQWNIYGNLTGNATSATTCSTHSRDAMALREIQYNKTNIKTWLDTNTNIHTTGDQGELSCRRFFTQDDSNYANYALPICDSHNLCFSIDNNTNWIRVFQLDMRTLDLWTTGKFGGTWQTGGTNGWYRVWRQGNSITGAVWNDYAEYRESNTTEPGYVLQEVGNDTLQKTTKRLDHFAGVSSDTWGFAQGETEKAKTPIAVAGRVLVYPGEERHMYLPGDCVCAGPDGKVYRMTREEVREWPDRIVGTVSCVPEYEEWGSGDRPSVKVDGRIWIKVK